MGEELVKKEQTAMATYDYGDDAGQEENITSDDLVVPQVFILQEKNKHLKELGKDAEVGWFYNSVSETACEELVGVMADKAQREFVEWHPRESKKGVAARHQAGSPVFEKHKDTFGRITLENGNELVDTYKVPIALDDGSFCFLNLSSTCIAPYKNFFTRLSFWRNSNGKPPYFAVKIRVKTKDKSNPKGDSKIPTFEAFVENHFEKSKLAPTDGLYQTGKQLSNLMKQGIARASEEPGEMNQAKGEDPFN